MPGEKRPKTSKKPKSTDERIVKAGFTIRESQFRALKVYAAEKGLGISEVLQKVLDKAGFR